jgi:gamma-glutamyltranspeptidase/glutathione hydrolase
MRLSSPHPQLRLTDGCVASFDPVACAMGTRVLREGGNAVDAAVTTALSLAVTFPHAGSLGGGGFMMIDRGADGVHCVDYRETSPRAIRLEHFRGDGAEGRTVIGALAVGVPGTIAGLSSALERFGTIPWARACGLAAELADSGVWLTARQAGYLAVHHPMLSRFPVTRRYFTELAPDGEPRAPLPGTLFRQPDLARTLRRLGEAGARDFYEGEIARAITDEIARGGGVLDGADLAAYQARWREPIRLRFLGSEVFTAPPPSGGGLVLQLLLALIEALDVRALAPGSVERIDLLARIQRAAYAVRWPLAGDPDALLPEATAALAAELARPIGAAELTGIEAGLPSAPDGDDPLARRSNTVHFCVLDRDGLAVSNTFSLNTMFGAKLAVDGCGFLLNNSIDDFAVDPELPNWYQLLDSARNRLAPTRRPASSMSPTVVRDGDRTRLVVGGSGGPRIPTLQSQLLLSILGDGMSVGEAMNVPRIHHQFAPDHLGVERRMPEAITTGLEVLGWSVERMPLLGLGVAIERLPADELAAAVDDRIGLD